jgi:hypothetical protein
MHESQRRRVARPGRRAAGRLVLLLAVVLAVSARSVPALATGTLTSPYPLLFGLSCSSNSLCAAIDDKGNAIISTDPTASRPSWRASAMGIPAPVAISCVATEMCLVLGINGQAAVSTDPTLPSPTWALDPGFVGGFIGGVSCPSTALCVAAEASGVAISTNPTGSAPTWAKSGVDREGRLIDVSCPSTALCVAVDRLGRVIVSTDPTSKAPVWSAPLQVDDVALAAVSCASLSFCVAVDAQGRATISQDPYAKELSHWSTPAGVVSTSYGGPTVSCTEQLCAAAGRTPTVNAAVTTELSSPLVAWQPETVMSQSAVESPASISCASMTLCAIAAVDDVSVSVDPATPNPTWSAAQPIDRIPAGRLELVGDLSLSGPVLYMRAHCGGEQYQECPATVTLTATESLSHGGRRVSGVSARTHARRSRVVVVGQESFNPGFAGGGELVKLTLNRLGRRLLARFRTLPATLTVSAETPEVSVPPSVAVAMVRRIAFTVPRRHVHHALRHPRRSRRVSSRAGARHGAHA